MTWKIIIIILLVYWLLLGDLIIERTDFDNNVTKIEYNGIVWVVLYKFYTDEEKPFFKITRTKI